METEFETMKICAFKITEIFYTLFLSQLPFTFVVELLDIAFVIDASQSTGSEINFRLIINFVKYIVRKFYVSQTQGTRFGLVLYDDYDGYLIFDFKSADSVTSVIQALDNVRYPSAKAKPPILTAFSHALILTNEILFNVQYRAGATKYLITVSSGTTFPRSERPSLSLRRAGVEIFSVDLSSGRSSDLEKVVSSEKSVHLIRSTYVKLAEISVSIIAKIKRKELSM